MLDTQVRFSIDENNSISFTEIRVTPGPCMDDTKVTSACETVLSYLNGNCNNDYIQNQCPGLTTGVLYVTITSNQKYVSGIVTNLDPIVNIVTVNNDWITL